MNQLYSFVQFENPALGVLGSTDLKESLRFDQSSKRLRLADFERHASSQEVFGIFCAAVHGELLPEYWCVYEDLLLSGGWLDLGFKREQDQLIAYTGLELLVWDSTQLGNHAQYTSKHSFSLRPVMDHLKQKEEKGFWTTEVSLCWFDKSFHEFLYGCPLKDMPSILWGNRSPTIHIPVEQNRFWPVARSIRNNLCCPTYAPSRGVRVQT